MSACTSTVPRPKRGMARAAYICLLQLFAYYGLVVIIAALIAYSPVWIIRFKGMPDAIDPPLVALLVISFLPSTMMAGGLLWCIWPRHDRFVVPGPLLSKSLNPMLFAEIENIARALHEPVPEELYLLPDVNAWATSLGRVITRRHRRAVGIGLPLLSALTISQFRAVVAHELGHYYGGDTRLVPFLRKARRSSVLVMETLCSRQKTDLMLLSLGRYTAYFLSSTADLFRSIEYRADELACHIESSSALIDALLLIHSTSSLFTRYWESEVVPILIAGYRPPIVEGFRLFLDAPAISMYRRAQLLKQLNSTEGASQIMADNTLGSYYDDRAPLAERIIATAARASLDSHPPLALRIKAAELLPDGTDIQNPASAWTLLGDLQHAEIQFLEAFGPRGKSPHKLRFVQWNDVGTLVTVPEWKNLVSRAFPLLADVNVENVFDTLPRLRELGALLPDPKGILLSVEQRTARAQKVVGMALGLLLLNNGWQIHSDPGQFCLRSGTDSLNPFYIMRDIASGRLTKAAWRVQCEQLDIAGRALVDVAAA
jgi:heat shock protein HtpX